MTDNPRLLRFQKPSSRIVLHYLFIVIGAAIVQLTKMVTQMRLHAIAPGR